MAKSDQRLLHIRVKYEPNRLSERCLETLYEQLSPVKPRPIPREDKASPDKDIPDSPMRKKGGVNHE